MKIFIADTNQYINEKRKLFVLARPFYNDNSWTYNFKTDRQNDVGFNRVATIAEADIVLIPLPVNFYIDKNKVDELNALQYSCFKYNKMAYAYVSGDFGMAYPEFSNITYFRMGGFQSQLSESNKGFPVALSDHFQGIYQKESIEPIAKRELAVVGFCGHATLSTLKRLKELAKCLKENGRRFLKNPFRKDWEPLFASAYERAQLLRSFENSALIKINFIHRNQYRAGAQTDLERQKTTLEYYDNIANSDYVLCVRGAGNFSVRFYETLMMGKIPVFVNTDCLLPFEDQIDWKRHVVWVEWKDRKNIAAIVSDFHRNCSNEKFIQLQLDNRRLWKEKLSIDGMLEMIASRVR